jgi:hypothetical protein
MSNAPTTTRTTPIERRTVRGFIYMKYIPNQGTGF